MRTKEEDFEFVISSREIVNDPKNLKCTCPQTECVWHGRCRECVAIHRYRKDHVPECFAFMVGDDEVEK